MNAISLELLPPVSSRHCCTVFHQQLPCLLLSQLRPKTTKYCMPSLRLLGRSSKPFAVVAAGSTLTTNSIPVCYLYPFLLLTLACLLVFYFIFSILFFLELKLSSLVSSYTRDIEICSSVYFIIIFPLAIIVRILILWNSKFWISVCMKSRTVPRVQLDNIFTFCLFVCMFPHP